MFCPNCGVNIEDKNQKFCTSCGSEFPSDIPSETQPETPQVKTPEAKPAPTYRVPAVPTYQSARQQGGPGTESKKCLIFALASIGLFIIGMAIVGSSLFGSFGGYYYLPTINLGAIGWIAAIILHIVGLVFAILSRVFSGRAEAEPINSVEKFGSVIAIFGIIINVIPIFVIPIIMVVTLGLFNPFTYYY